MYLNNYYITVIKKSIGIRPVNVVVMNDVSGSDPAINMLIEAYKNCPSVKKIKEIFEKKQDYKLLKFHSVTRCYTATVINQTDKESHRCRQNATKFRETICKNFV